MLVAELFTLALYSHACMLYNFNVGAFSYKKFSIAIAIVASGLGKLIALSKLLYAEATN